MKGRTSFSPWLGLTQPSNRERLRAKDSGWPARWPAMVRVIILPKTIVLQSYLRRPARILETRRAGKRVGFECGQPALLRSDDRVHA